MLKLKSEEFIEYTVFFKIEKWRNHLEKTINLLKVQYTVSPSKILCDSVCDKIEHNFSKRNDLDLINNISD